MRLLRVPVHPLEVGELKQSWMGFKSVTRPLQVVPSHLATSTRQFWGCPSIATLTCEDGWQVGGGSVSVCAGRGCGVRHAASQAAHRAGQTGRAPVHGCRRTVI